MDAFHDPWDARSTETSMRVSMLRHPLPPTLQYGSVHFRSLFSISCVVAV